MTDDDLASKRARSLRYMFGKVPFTVALKMELVSYDEQSATVRLPYSDLVDNGGGTAHGGAIAALVDNAAAAAAWAGHDYDKGVRSATVSVDVDYLAGTRGGPVDATATVLRRAKELNFVRVDVRDEGGRLIAAGSVVYRIGN